MVNTECEDDEKNTFLEKTRYFLKKRDTTIISALR